jgi:hypothetical protein
MLSAQASLQQLQPAHSALQPPPPPHTHTHTLTPPSSSLAQTRTLPLLLLSAAVVPSCCHSAEGWWACCLPVQGSLLSGLLEAPLYLSSVVVGLPLAPAVAAKADPSEPAVAPAAPLADKEGVAAAEAALRRALLERTAGLAAERLPSGFHQASPALHIHRQSPPPAPAAGSSSSVSAAALGLAPSPTRRVAAGSSAVWCAPPSSAFKWKAADGGTAVLSGGSSEGVVGSTGLRSGSSKVPPGQAAPPSAQPAVCKAALFAQWQALAAALHQLSHPDSTQAASGAGGRQQAAAAPQPPRGMTYRQAKRAACPAYSEEWARLLQRPSPLQSWIPKPPALEEFALQPSSP